MQRLDRTRQHRGHAGAGDPSPSGRLGLVAPDRDVADGDARDVGDRIRRACLESADVEAELAEREAHVAEARSRDERTVHPVHSSHGRVMLRADRAHTTIRGTGGHNFDGVDVVKASGAQDSGHRRRHEARAHEALGARRGSCRGDRRGELGGVDRLAAGHGELGSGRHAGRRERDSAHRYDELHRLVQPVELHRGAGAERHGHGLPAPRPARLHEGKEGYVIVGDWAKSWKASNGGKTWTFKLRPNGSGRTARR